ncbi:MAG TPA: M20/M25/M40 family metallo-hydrolase [Chloroflexota bacterium]|nr:M20/M25/M40 family metallo-hydrolase [Chloroflexota bacterium]
MTETAPVADPLTDEAVRHLQGLLQIDTSNPPGNETAAADYLAGILHAAGYDPAVLAAVPGRGNVVARYPGTGELPPFLLYGHVDVVPADEASWNRGPFSGEIADGCVWGRGALDMKSMVAQELMVMLLLQRNGVRLRRDVIFAATADEEVGGDVGIGFLVDEHPDLVRAEYALSEGGGTTMYIGGKEFYDIRTAEKGTYRFALRTAGTPAHAAIPRPDTAVERAARAATALATTPLPFRTTATAAAFFRETTRALGLPEGERVLSEKNLERVMGRLPADLQHFLHAITHDTAVPTGLRAGRKINVIPGEAEVLVDGRYLPGQTPEGFVEEVRAVVGTGAVLEPIDVTRPLEDPPGGLLYETIVDVMRRHAPRATLLPTMLAGATDAKHVGRLGTTCLGFGPLRVPPGFPSDSLVHGHNERVPIEGYIWGINVLYDIVTRFCS